jgi:uncharacterized pyridoxamine 5'-phosphate oxidase family protein
LGKEMTQKNEKEVEVLLSSLLKEELFAVLVTKAPEYPYTSLVAFSVTDDLKNLFFVTTKFTRKYHYLIADERAALFIDNRSNRYTDLIDAITVSAMGRIKEVERQSNHNLEKIYLSKHPYLEEFLSSPSSALMCMHVKRYLVVKEFQNVTEIEI